MASKQKQPPPKSDAELITIIAGALAVGAAAQATANSLSPLIGIPTPPLLLALLLSESKPVSMATAVIPKDSAAAVTTDRESAYRAGYVLSASRRLQAALDGGLSREEAMRRERQWFEQHLAATKNRAASARAVDQAARQYGDELGWYAKMDNRTSAECKEANGKNFHASQIPPIGYPGAVHPFCRCKPGKAHRTRQTVYTVRTDRKSA